MSNKQQTAVEWLVSHFLKLQSDGEKMTWNQIIDITKLAKELEKQQIEDSFDNGKYKFGTSKEQYYKETYGE